MFQISSSPSRRKSTSALAVLAAMGVSGMASQSDAATTEYAPAMAGWSKSSAYAYFGTGDFWHNFNSDVTNPSWRSISGAGGAYGPARTWFDWSIPGLGTETISQATLKVQALSGYYGLGVGRTIKFGLITQTWDSTQPGNGPPNTDPGAWNNSGTDGNGPNLVAANGSTNPVDLLTYTSTTDGGLFNVDVTPLLQAWAANPSLYHGIGGYSPDTANSQGGIYSPVSDDYPGITGHLIVDTAVVSGPPTWNVSTAGDWTVASNWSGGSPNGVDQEANFLSAISQARTVYADTPVTVGTMRFDNANTYHITGAGTLTLQTTNDVTTPALIDVNTGTHKINLPLVVASNTNLDVASGATLKISDPVTVNSGKSVTQIGAGTVTYESTVTLLSSSSIAFGSSQHLAGLTVGDNATATLSQNGSRVLEADSLSISSTGGKVDLKNNKMVFRGQGAGAWTGSAYDGVSGLVASDRITTSMPDAADLLTSLAVKTDGAGDTHVVYTYTGDSDIDGTIDGDDYAAIDAGFSANLKNYHNGDFDYSGKIDADDYWLIDRNYSKQGAPFAPAGLPGGVSAVPEPASAGVLGACLTAILMRRRRRA